MFFWVAIGSSDWSATASINSSNQNLSIQDFNYMPQFVIALVVMQTAEFVMNFSACLFPRAFSSYNIACGEGVNNYTS